MLYKVAIVALLSAFVAIAARTAMDVREVAQAITGGK
jgi:hypothetical protein